MSTLYNWFLHHVSCSCPAHWYLCHRSFKHVYVIICTDSNYKGFEELVTRINVCINIQGFNQPSQMPNNVIFPTELNFPIRLKYVFYFMFSLTFKAFVIFVTFLLFQSNLYVVLARGKGPKNGVHKGHLKTKNPPTPPPPLHTHTHTHIHTHTHTHTQLLFTCLTVRG